MPGEKVSGPFVLGSACGSSTGRAMKRQRSFRCRAFSCRRPGVTSRLVFTLEGDRAARQGFVR
jgi:hypothetical protein